MTRSTWYRAETDNPPEPVGIRIIGTGHPIEVLPGKFIGTFQVSDGGFVGHVFLR